MNLYDEMADMMAASWTVGPHVSREQTHGRASQEVSDRSRIARGRGRHACEQVTRHIESIEAQGHRIVGIAKEAPK